ncbi:MAG TPA: response regulator [Candidatus Handelsmanbacteria bacterium]|nr:response regulator [Candidatus Handelsmanbacteria bacterium]
MHNHGQTQYRSWQGACHQGGKQAILVTDDSNIARKTMAKNLEYYGFETFEAPSGTEGL